MAELKGTRIVHALWALDENQTDPDAVALSKDRETFDTIVGPAGAAETGACPRTLNARFVAFPDLGELGAVGDPSHLDEH